ncbi:MAG: tRNA guanosine(34) transglycosylase Tgt [Holosporales bacterium]|jgi:queuine tRNA-ribosyltransferase|nr:tRNA guanosine(34) transglycosylase Tgt [Holosporales bacterium]
MSSNAQPSLFTCTQQSPDSHFNSSTKSKARLGCIRTPHGEIQTPAFIFCATNGAIKAVTAEDMRVERTQIILSNTFHLMSFASHIKKLGGLAHMSGWGGPTLTDSGGYQIFSMGYGSVAEEIKCNRKFPGKRPNVKISEDGVVFKSCISGESLFLSPERSIEIQEEIGADLIVAFDECTPYNVDRTYTEHSMRRSHRWEKRSLVRFNELEAQKPEYALPQAMYGIVQGGVYEDLRKESCDFVNNELFFGQAIGGSLGASTEQMREVIGITMQQLRADRPTHLLGIGRISDIFDGVEIGIDTFDCVHPTRLARHGGALVKGGDPHAKGDAREHINLKNSVYVGDEHPIEQDCLCQTCQKYSRGYIHHLIKKREILAHLLIARHNVRFMNDLMADVREGIATATLPQVKNKWLGSK